MAQQKQPKQPILINGKNIFTYCFQPIQRLQPDFTTDGIRNFMAQQKQCKQPILIDGKNIFTYCFQSIQRLQPNSKTYAIRNNFMYTKHNGDNPKLRIFSFISEQRRIQPNFMKHTYQTTNQTNTTQTTKTTTSTWVSPPTQSLCCYNWDNANSEYSYSHFNQHQKIHIQPISYISSITNLYILSIPKNLYAAWWTISYISSIPAWIRYLL